MLLINNIAIMFCKSIMTRGSVHFDHIIQPLIHIQGVCISFSCSTEILSCSMYLRQHRRFSLHCFRYSTHKKLTLHIRTMAIFQIKGSKNPRNAYRRGGTFMFSCMISCSIWEAPSDRMHLLSHSIS